MGFMALSGVKWDATNEEIIDAIKLAKGRVRHAAIALGVSFQCFYKRMQSEPDIKKALDEERKMYEHSLLDDAENVLEHALSLHKEDINAALKSSFFVLNNKGRERGYSPKNNPNVPDISLEDVANYVRQISTNIKEISGTSEPLKLPMEIE